MGFALDRLLDWVNDAGATIDGGRKPGTHSFRLVVRPNPLAKPIEFEGNSYDHAAREVLSEIIGEPRPEHAEKQTA